MSDTVADTSSGMLALTKARPGLGGLALDRIAAPPRPGSGQVLLRVLAAGICGTDIHIYKWGSFAHRMRLPTVLGHEMCGVVEAVGAGVTRVAPGARVSVESHVPCGSCYTCHRGWSHVCPNTRYPGVDFNGGFASHVLLPAAILWPVPDGISDDVAAMMEPFGIAVHASMEGTGVAGQNVLIAGCGPIGLMNVAVAHALGANRIIATDVNPIRLRTALALGADRAIDVSVDDPSPAVDDLTRAQGVDVAIEYSGHSSSLRLASELLANGGELRLVGVPEGDVGLDLTSWLLKGVTVRNIHGRRLFASWEQGTRLLLDKQVDIRSLVSHRLPLVNGLAGFDAVLAGLALKVLLVPGDGPPIAATARHENARKDKAP